MMKIMLGDLTLAKMFQQTKDKLTSEVTISLI